MGITLPALNGIRNKAQSLRGAANMRIAAGQLCEFSKDHDDKYPDSVATIGLGDSWNWYDLRKMVTVKERNPAVHRSMSAYLRDYIDDPRILYCPRVPDEYKYLHKMWDDGDAWDHPETPMTADYFNGTYCFYWNYQGYVPSADGLSRKEFLGPAGPASGGRFSKLLLSDYLSFGAAQDNPPPCTFASCEQFEGSSPATETQVVAPYWAGSTGLSANLTLPEIMGALPAISLKAVFTDEHVETYKASDTTSLWVIKDRSNWDVYKPAGSGSPGIFFIPLSATYGTAR